jgi:hypothetical protein
VVSFYGTCDGISHDKRSVFLHLVLSEVRVLYPIWLFYVATWCRDFLVCCSGIFWKISTFLHLLIIIITVIHIFVRMTHSVSWIGFDLDYRNIRVSLPVVVRKKNSSSTASRRGTHTIELVREALSPGTKRPKSEADKSPAPAAELNVCGYKFNPPQVFMKLCFYR